MAKQKITDTEIIRHLANKHLDDFFVTEVKDGPSMYRSHLRLDALAVKKSWARPCFTAYEVKTSRSDFLKDEKWPGYLSLCHRLYFVCPQGMIKKEELKGGSAGLIYYRQGKTTPLWTALKAPYRDIEIPVQMVMHILFSKLDSDRYPFFKERQEYFEQWLEEKKSSRQIGWEVGTQIWQRLANHEEKKKLYDRTIERWKKDNEKIESIRNLLKKYDVHFYNHESMIEELEDRLKCGVNPQIKSRVNRIKRNVEEIEMMLEDSGSSGT